MDGAESATTTQGNWRWRPLLLAAIGLVAGLSVHLLLGKGDPSPPILAALVGVVLAAGLTGFTLERHRWRWSLAFSLGTALVGALVVYWNGDPGDWNSGEGWRMVSLLLAVAVAAPLFQAARDEGAARFPYASVHDHAWTNVVLWAACWAFVAIVFALAWLLAALFGLIRIEFLRQLLEKEWFWRMLVGVAFGAGLGLLREHDGVVRLLQRVVAMVLAVLAPVLALGLVLFVLALPFTGLEALWDATRATTPTLLGCVIGALILANAVIGDEPAHERRFPALRYGAIALTAVVLPLAVLAAVATGLRIDQYGFTPERLWALVFVALATAYGLAYLVSVVLARGAWAARLRVANLRLAFGVLGVALLLATPLISFNAISTRDQVARLESGRIAADAFDWAALAFDFGAPGRAALARLRASANPAIKAQASQAFKAKGRWDLKDRGREVRQRAEVAANVRVLPRGGALPAGLRDALAQGYACSGKQKCSVLLVSSTEALLFQDRCFVVPPFNPREPAAVASPVGYDCRSGSPYRFEGGKWEEGRPTLARTPDEQRRIAERYAAGEVEIRTVPRRQAYVGGVPVSEPFE